MINVATGIVFNSEQKILVAQRTSRAHLTGLWEFPGGKIEDQEDCFQALVRELEEEVGIHVLKAQPFVDKFYDYGEKQVLLHVWLVQEFLGQAYGREGQPIRWANLDEIATLELPPVNREILHHLRQYLPK